MQHWALSDDIFNPIIIPGSTTTTTLTPGNGLGVSGNKITVTPTFTPKAGSVSASCLTFSNGDGVSVQLPVDIFNV